MRGGQSQGRVSRVLSKAKRISLYYSLEIQLVSVFSPLAVGSDSRAWYIHHRSCHSTGSVRNLFFCIILVLRRAHSAKTMSKRFPGSRVLTQDSPGVCPVSSLPWRIFHLNSHPSLLSQWALNLYTISYSGVLPLWNTSTRRHSVPSYLVAFPRIRSS